MTRPNSKIWPKIGMAAGLAVSLILGSWLFRRWYAFRQRKTAARLPEGFRFEGVHPEIRGLTEEQALNLLPVRNEEADQLIRQRKFRKTVIRQTLFTIFNFNIFATMVVNLLLHNFTGLLSNLGLLVVNLSLQVFQIMYTKRHMDELVKSLRPRASVIRDGQLRSVAAAQIVPGDALTVSAGDQILVAGTLMGDESLTLEYLDAAGVARRVTAHPGNSLPAGSYCVSGRGVYTAHEGGWLRHTTDDGYQVKLLKSKRTPLQRATETMLYILLGIVIFFSALLVTNALLATPELVSATYQKAFSIIFGVAPTSLFMMLILNNVVGVVQISRRGALVYDPQVIESLAQVKTLCISKESLVSGMQVLLKPIESADNPLAENIIRQILGDALQSIPSLNPRIERIAEALPGERRVVKEAIPYRDAWGWMGITFANADRQGTFILGRQAVLAEYLRAEKTAVRERVAVTVANARQGMIKFLQRSPQKSTGADSPIPQPEPLNGDENQIGGRSEEAAKPVQRLRVTLLRWLTPVEELQEPEAGAQPAPPDDEQALLLAYRPKSVFLRDRKGNPRLPKDLIPLAWVHVNEIIRPETQKAIKTLLDGGMQIKILTAEPPERVLPIAQELGIAGDELRMVSGAAWQATTDIASEVQTATIFGDLTPAGKARIISALQVFDAQTMMIGSTVSDIPAMKQAFLRVAPRGAAQAALQRTDIVLLDESIATLPRIVTQGQRMITGVLITFKLQLSQVLMQLLLILLLFFGFLNAFPYQPTQASVAAVFTMTIPNIFLVVWASARRLTRENVIGQITRFIIPMGVSLAVLVSGISIYFSGASPSDPIYIHVQVAYALLLAGWVRVLFVQPPHLIWAGGTPLRGDARVYRVVGGSALLLVGLLMVPYFRESFRITLLASWGEFFVIVLAVLLWALSLKAFWWITNKLGQKR